MKKLFLLFAILSLFIASGIGAVEYRKQIINCATANPPGSQHDIALQAFKKIVEEESGGNIEVRLFLSGSMGDEQTNIRQLRTGELHL
ncbi:MAG: C4-dicarboxylate ABC transporter substrate-binding protein, partial [Planctomycetes bacterium]|nr:C4-dicarboxylate ABC transporter substrate-binding protein [Planctomycetota bacterium]